MKISTAEYITSGIHAAHYPDDRLPEIALVGRSNVGKSSLINALLGRRNLARTSSQPGKTRAANFYLINDGFYLVDLPGYGYAKVSQSERQRFERMITSYLTSREELRLVLQVVDFRHPPTALDQAMYDLLQQAGAPRIVVANKVDKVGRSKWEVNRKGVLASLPGLHQDALILFSAETRQGVEELWKHILAALSPQ
jgi:GTP-binding protein